MESEVIHYGNENGVIINCQLSNYSWCPVTSSSFTLGVIMTVAPEAVTDRVIVLLARLEHHQQGNNISIQTEIR